MSFDDHEKSRSLDAFLKINFPQIYEPIKDVENRKGHQFTKMKASLVR